MNGRHGPTYWGDEWDKPFLYPIKTVSGKVLSRGWPLEPREGDSNGSRVASRILVRPRRYQRRGLLAGTRAREDRPIGRESAARK